MHNLLNKKINQARQICVKQVSNYCSSPPIPLLLNLFFIIGYQIEKARLCFSLHSLIPLFIRNWMLLCPHIVGSDYLWGNQSFCTKSTAEPCVNWRTFELDKTACGNKKSGIYMVRLQNLQNKEASSKLEACTFSKLRQLYQSKSLIVHCLRRNYRKLDEPPGHVTKLSMQTQTLYILKKKGFMSVIRQNCSLP